MEGCCRVRITRESATYVMACDTDRIILPSGQPIQAIQMAGYLEEPLEIDLGDTKVWIDPATGQVDLPPFFDLEESSSELPHQYLTPDINDPRSILEKPVDRYQIPPGSYASFLRGSHGGRHETVYINRGNRTLLHVGNRDPIQLWPL
jgi:hypothetical protein